jgi:hypothetical protein
MTAAGQRMEAMALFEEEGALLEVADPEEDVVESQPPAGL